MKTIGRSRGSDTGSSPFLRGLTIGVLVGAAIAGSRIWRRLLRRLDLD
jgi:hypothetical protein